MPRGSASSRATSRPRSSVSWTEARPTGVPSAMATSPSMASGSSTSPRRAIRCVPPWFRAIRPRAHSWSAGSRSRTRSSAARVTELIAGLVRIGAGVEPGPQLSGIRLRLVHHPALLAALQEHGLTLAQRHEMERDRLVLLLPADQPGGEVLDAEDEPIAVGLERQQLIEARR